MYPAGHYGISLIAFAPILALLFVLGHPMLAIIGLTVIVATAPLPDIDIKPPFRYFMPHRGPTHTVWFAFLVGGVTGGMLAFIPPSVFGVGLLAQMYFGFFFGVYGIIGHLLGDAINPTGVRPFWPKGPKYSYPITSAKGVWWFESIKSGNQEQMTLWEAVRHRILNSNRVFLFLGLLASGVASLPYVVYY